MNEVWTYLNQPWVVALATLASLLSFVGINFAMGGQLVFWLCHPLLGYRRRWTDDRPEVTNRRKVYGRDAAVRELRSILTGGEVGAIVPAPTVTGGAGVGKTTLARHYALCHQVDYDRTEIIRSETEQSLMQDLAEVANRIEGRKPAQLRERAEAALELIADRTRTERWLLIFDNAEGAEQLLRWLPQGRNLHVLITTRDPDWPGDRFRVQPAGVLDLSDAVALLQAEAGREDPAAAQLAKDLGRLPLALVQAGDWLAAHPRAPFETYRQKLLRLVDEWPDVPGRARSYDQAVGAALRLSIGALSRDARTLLAPMCHLSPDHLDDELFLYLAEMPWRARFSEMSRPIPWRLWAICRSTARYQAARRELRARGLLEDRGEDTMGVHRLTQLVGRRQLGDATKGAAAAAVLAAQYPYGVSDFQNWPACARLTPHVAALFDRGDPPATAAMDRLLNQAALYLGQQAEHDRAVDFARAALDMKVLRLPAGHREIAVGHSTFGSSLRATGRLEEAEREQAESVRLRAALVGEPEMQTAGWNNHGRALEALGRWVEAARRYQQALALACATFGSGHDYVAGALSNLARVRNALGQRALALALARKALRLRRANLAPGDPRVALSLNNLGAYLLTYGAADLAEPVLAEALAINSVAYGRDDHPEVVTTATWLAVCLLARAAAGEDRADREARAQALAVAQGLDAEAERRAAAALPYRPGVDPLEGYVYKPPPDRAANLPSTYFRSE